MSDATERVHICDDYYEHEQFRTLPQTEWSKNDVYDVSREQLARWEAASAAWGDAQAEMAALMEQRREQRQAEQAVQLEQAAEHQQREDEQNAERQRREDTRRAKIRAELYGGKKKT